MMKNTSLYAACAGLIAAALLLSGCPGKKPALVSQFAAADRIGEAPLTLTFGDIRDEAGGDSPVIDTWLWDFGDGATSTEAEPVHTYTTPDNYTVTLTTTSGRQTSTTVIENYVHVLDPDRIVGTEPGEEAVFAGITFVWIPPGQFLMGADDPGTANNWYDAVPAHTVTLSRGFWMSKYELTQADFVAMFGLNDSFFRLPLEPSSTLPAESISWRTAQAITDHLNANFSDGLFRLPTEAEWEYACRAGTDTDFYFGDDPHAEGGIQDHGWTNANAGGVTHLTGELLANAWGLYDMHGNVWEWTLDRYSPTYSEESPDTDPLGPDFGVYRVARGGSWYHQPYTAASPSRLPFLVNAPYNSVGVRLVMQ